MDTINYKGRSFDIMDFEKFLDRIEKGCKQEYKTMLQQIEANKQKELAEKFGDSKDRFVEIGNVTIYKRYKKSGEPYYIWYEDNALEFGEL